jgi:hypothetical protein
MAPSDGATTDPATPSPHASNRQGHKNKNFPIRSSYFRGAKYVHSSNSLVAQTRDGSAMARGPQQSSKAGAGLAFDRSLLIATGSLDKVRERERARARVRERESERARGRQSRQGVATLASALPPAQPPTVPSPCRSAR